MQKKLRSLQLGPHFDPFKAKKTPKACGGRTKHSRRGCSRGQHTSAIYTYAAAAMLCLWRLLLLFVREAESERAIPKLVKRGLLTASSTSLSEKKLEKATAVYSGIIIFSKLL